MLMGHDSDDGARPGSSSSAAASSASPSSGFSSLSAGGIISLPLRLPFRLVWMLLRAGLRALRAAVWRPRWWVAALEVVTMGAFFYRSYFATVFLTHPIAWALAPGIAGLASSLFTLLLMFLAGWQGACEADAAVARGDADADADVSARTVRIVSAVCTATPVAWGLVAVALRFMSSTSLLLPLGGIAAVAWGWWRVVSLARSPPPEDERQRQRERRQWRRHWEREQQQWERDQQQQQRQQQYPRPPPGFAGWGQWQRHHQQQQQHTARGRHRALHHLLGEAPPGATGDVARVLRARNFFEVLGFETKVASSSSSSSSSSSGSLPVLNDEAVKASWRRLVKSVHPDRQRICSSGQNGNGSGSGGHPSSLSSPSASSSAVGAEEAFNLVTEAFEALKDAGARACYARVLGVS